MFHISSVSAEAYVSLFWRCLDDVRDFNLKITATHGYHGMVNLKHLSWSRLPCVLCRTTLLRPLKWWGEYTLMFRIASGRFARISKCHGEYYQVKSISSWAGLVELCVKGLQPTHVACRDRTTWSLQSMYAQDWPLDRRRVMGPSCRSIISTTASFTHPSFDSTPVAYVLRPLLQDLRQQKVKTSAYWK